MYQFCGVGTVLQNHCFEDFFFFGFLIVGIAVVLTLSLSCYADGQGPNGKFEFINDLFDFLFFVEEVSENVEDYFYQLFGTDLVERVQNLKLELGEVFLLGFNQDFF